MTLRQLALSGFLALALTVGGLSLPIFQQLSASGQQATSVRASLIAEALAQRIDAALEAGVPLSQLVGVNELFAQHGRHDADILAISLIDAQGHPLYRLAGHEGLDAPATVAEVSLAHGAGSRVEVRYANASDDEILLEIAAAVISISVLGGALALCLLQFDAETGPWPRERAVRRLCRAIHAGKLGRLPETLRPCRFDRRPQWLMRRIRTLREDHARLSRIVDSLMLTEPSPEGRKRLSAVKLLCETGLDFGDNSRRRFAVFNQEALAFTPALFLLAAAAAIRFPLPAEYSAGSILAVSWLALAIGTTLARRVPALAAGARPLLPAALPIVALLAFTPLPAFVRTFAAALVIGTLVGALPTNQRFAPLFLGDIAGTLAATLLVGLAPDMPAFLSLAGAGAGWVCWRCCPPPAPRRGDDTAPAFDRKRRLSAPMHGIGLGIGVGVAVAAVQDDTFTTLLPLAGILGAIACCAQVAPPAWGWRGSSAIAVATALLYSFFPHPSMMTCACTALALAGCSSGHRPHAGTGCTWLMCAIGGGLSAAALALGASASAVLLGAAILCALGHGGGGTAATGGH